MDNRFITEGLQRCSDHHEKVLARMEAVNLEAITDEMFLAAFAKLINSTAVWLAEPSIEVGETLFVKSLVFATMAIERMEMKQEAVDYARSTLAHCVGIAQADLARASGEVQ